MSIDMLTPTEAALCKGELQKKWSSCRLIAIRNRQESLTITENSLPLPACQGLTRDRRSEGIP